MNIENMKKLIGQLERLPDEQFEMGVYIDHRSCGTTACIAGWCSLLNGGPQEDEDGAGDPVFYFSAAHLGLTEREAERLFLNGCVDQEPWHGDGRLEIPLSDAITELKRMVSEAEAAQP